MQRVSQSFFVCSVFLGAISTRSAQGQPNSPPLASASAQPAVAAQSASAAQSAPGVPVLASSSSPSWAPPATAPALTPADEVLTTLRKTMGENKASPATKRSSRETDSFRRESKVQFVSPNSNVIFHIKTGDAWVPTVTPGPNGALISSAVKVGVFHKLCKAPCEVSLLHGTYTFGLSDGDDQPVETEESVVVMSPTTVRGTYHSYMISRTTTYLLGATLLLGGTIVTLTAFSSDSDSGDKMGKGNKTQGIAGVIMMTASVPAFFVAYYLLTDGAEVEKLHNKSQLPRMFLLPGVSDSAGSAFSPAVTGATLMGYFLRCEI